MNEFRKEVNKIMQEVERSLPAPKTILYLDDEVCNLFTFKVNFRRLAGYKVITAQTEKQALEALKNNKIDVFITDYRMPKINGCKMIEKVSKLYPSIKSMIITAYSEGIKSTVPILHKPFNIPEIVQNISYL